MRIWADADALPTTAKNILFRAAERVGVAVCLVANKPLRVPDSPWLTAVVVPAGADVADDWIVERVAAGDLVVTADVPLAYRAVLRGAVGLDPRGDLFTEDNVREKLATRDLLEELRNSSGLPGSGPAPYGPRDGSRFANALQGLLQRKR